MQPSNQTNSSKRTINFVILAVIIVGLVVAGGYYLLHKSSSNGSTQQQAYVKGPHNEDYSSTDNYKLSGGNPGQGISFDKPASYKVAITTKDNNQVSFSHSLKTPTYAPLGAMHVAVVPSATETTPDALKSMNKTMATPNTDSYKSLTAASQEFLKSRFSPLYDINFSNAEAIKTSNFKDNAWRIPFSAKPKPTSADTSNKNTGNVPENATNPSKAQTLSKTKPPVGFENFKGEVMLIIGKKTFYYVGIFNTDYNWSNNSKVWQQIETSIKIDQ
jgi:hypothetical protein